MIKALQRRFIVTAMIAITVLIVTVLGALNISNAIITVRRTDRFLETLIADYSRLWLEKAPSIQMPMRSAPPSEQFGDGGAQSAYFIVYFDQNGERTKVDISNIRSVPRPVAAKYGEAAAASGKSEGAAQSFRFRSARLGANGDEGEMYIFLETASQRTSILQIGVLSLLAGVIGWLLMFLLVIFLAQQAIRPIAANIERQKQFVTDAGHEIKTPLAIIMANTDAMELHSGENKYSRNIRRQTVRLSGLMQDLLTLSRLDEGRILAGGEQVGVSDLVQTTAGMFAEAMELKGICYEENIPAEQYTPVNRDLYTRLFSILYDNAVKYCPEQGNVKASLRKLRKGTAFELYNDCETLPPCAPDRLFDRFYRADQSRVQKQGGYGIGLSAARSIVEACGGSIAVSYVGTSGIVFTVKIA